MFAKFYNEIERKPEWLEAAKSGYDFLKKYCFDNDGRMYFIVARDGAPIRKRRYFFSETFAVIAFAEYYKASGDMEALLLARKTFKLLMDLYNGNVHAEPKYLPTAAPSKALAVPMILLATLQCLREADGNDHPGPAGHPSQEWNDHPGPAGHPSQEGNYAAISKVFVDEIINDFLKPEEHALFETVGINGEKLDSPAGRCINPGHSIEASWFLMLEGRHNSNSELIKRAAQILNWSFELGWDKSYGGLFSFIDIEGKPPQQLEWDMKLWWPHTEALYAFLLAADLCGSENSAMYLDKFKLVHEYAFSHFPDTQHGEWFGYLHRDGTVANSLKGSLFKGFFHLPRSLLFCYQLLNGWQPIQNITVIS